MKYARDFRHDALTVLNGRWGLAVGANLLFGILNGGLIGILTPTYRLDASHFTETIDSLDSLQAAEPLNAFGLAGVFAPVNPMIFLIMALISVIFAAIGASVQLGYYTLNQKYYQPDQTPTIGDLFCRFSIFWKAFGLRLLTGLFVFLWTLLFVIPGIIAGYRYAMAPYIMAENPEIGIMEALRQSSDLMKGNKWRLFCLHISFIGWAFLCLFTLGIGYLFLSPYQVIAEAGFYREITGKNMPQSSVTPNPYTNPIQ